MSAQLATLNTNSRYLQDAPVELAERLLATAAGPLRPGAAGQLGQRGQRPGLADRPPRHRRVRRHRHRVGLPRRHRGHLRVLPRELARRRAACPHAAGAAAARGALGASSSRPQPGGVRPRRGRDARRRRLHQRRGARARPRVDAGGRRGRPRRQAGCTSPTRCRRATAAPDSTCGASWPGTCRPTSSRWASRWATATRWPPSSARPHLVDPFVRGTDYFSTFGGSTAACAAALAVLRTIDEEDLVDRAAAVGAHLLDALARGRVGSARPGRRARLGAGPRRRRRRPATGRPDADRAGRIVEGMRERGVLVGRTGRDRATLKIRPPLVFAGSTSTCSSPRWPPPATSSPDCCEGLKWLSAVCLVTRSPWCGRKPSEDRCRG